MASGFFIYRAFLLIKMDGYIKLFRKFTEWEWFKISEAVHLFIFLLLNANHKDNKWQGIEIKRGQILTGLQSLNKHTGISIMTLRTCINRLKSTGEITIKSTNKYSVITICKYDDYQNICDDTNRQTNRQTNKQLTSNQQTTNKQLTTNNNDKNDNNVNNDKKINGFDFKFLEPEYKEIFINWIEYKKARKESYKTQASLELCYAKMKKLAANNSETAKLIVNNSMANNWAGLFEITNFTKQKINPNWVTQKGIQAAMEDPDANHF
jgi:hypothetical protein